MAENNDQNNNLQQDDNLQQKAEETESTKSTEQEGQDEDKFECDINIEDSGPWKKKITVVIPRKEIDREKDREFKELRTTADVPGFRKGRAPRRLLEKRFGKDISDQTKMKLLARAFGQIEEDQDFEILGEPDFDMDKVVLPETGDMTFEYEIEVKPDFDLPELEGIKVEKRIIDITDEQIDEAIDNYRRHISRLEDVEKADKGDFIRADIVFKVEGIEEPAVMNDYPLMVSDSPIYGFNIDGLETLLKGVSVGDTKTTTGVGAETHEKEEYRNKKADISITIKRIQRRKLPEINAEFLETIGVDSMEELREMVQDQLEDQAERDTRRQMADQITEYLRSNIEFELPEGVAARHADRFVANQYYELLSQGVSQDVIQQNMEQIRAASVQRAASELKMSFIMDKIVDHLGIEVSEGEINAFIAQAAVRSGRRPEKLRDELQRQGRLESIRDSILRDKAIETLLEMAEIVDAPETDDATDTPETKDPADTKKTKTKSKKADKKSADDTDKE